MARQPRFFVPGETLHVIQRGNNRGPIFAAEDDYRFFLNCLARASGLLAVHVHAYVLMTNHVHLLVTPRLDEGLPKVIQSVGRRYVQYFNQAYRRTGTLWEGRYRATVIDSERYLLTCMRYVELNPVRAGMVGHPAQYSWSSYHVDAMGAPDHVVTHHELYERLGQSAAERQAAYRQLFRSQLPHSDLDAIREATHKNWALGNERFKKRVEELSGRRASPSPRGGNTAAPRHRLVLAPKTDRV